MAMSSVSRSEHTEGSVAKSIEQQTAKLPSILLPLGRHRVDCHVGDSSAHRPQEQQRVRRTVGPTFLILGLYNKLVKQLG